MLQGNQGPHSDKTCFPTADEPFIPSRGDSAQSTGCDTYMAVHSRLDVIEEVMRVTWEDMQLQDHLPGWWWLWRAQANLVFENWGDLGQSCSLATMLNISKPYLYC